LIAEAVLSSTHVVILTFDILENPLLPHALRWIVAVIIRPHEGQIHLSAEVFPSALIFPGYFSG